MKPIYVWQHRVNGEVIGEIRRFPKDDGKKDDIPFYKVGEHDFEAGGPQAPYPLLGLDTVVDCFKPLFIVEGQKKQQALASLGFQVVCCLFGSKSAGVADWTPIKDCKRIFLLPDNDAPGEKFAQEVWAIIQAFNPELIRIVRLPNLKKTEDVCDFLKRLPELEDWNEYDALEDHPEREGIADKFFNAAMAGKQEIPGHWEAPQDWNEPENLAKPLRPVTRLVANAIPLQLRAWCTDIAHRMQCPLEYVAVSALITAASAIGARAAIKPKQKDSWTEYGNLWGIVCGPPGTLKTPALREAMMPLVKMDDVLFEEYEVERKAYENQKAKYDAEAKAYKDAGAKAGRYSKVVDEGPPEKPDEPICKRFIANDTTVEAMAKLFADNPHGLLLFQDELSHLLMNWDKADKASDRPFYLAAWDGRGRKTVDRVSRPSLRVSNMCLSIFGGMQPDTVRNHLVNTSDNVNDGLLQRFQMAVYISEDEINEFKIVDEYPDFEARDKATRLIKDLVNTDYESFGGVKDEGELAPYFSFDAEAQELFFEWYRELHAEIKKENNPMIAQHLSKYRKLMPTLALIFHCLEIVDQRKRGDISRANCELAIVWCGFLEEHARRIYDMTSPTEIRAAYELAKHVKSGKLPTPFAIRHVQRGNWKGLTKREHIDQAITALQEHGWIRLHRQRPGAQGGAPKIEYHINPKLLTHD